MDPIGSQERKISWDRLARRSNVTKGPQGENAASARRFRLISTFLLLHRNMFFQVSLPQQSRFLRQGVAWSAWQGHISIQAEPGPNPGSWGRWIDGSGNATHITTSRCSPTARLKPLLVIQYGHRPSTGMLFCACSLRSRFLCGQLKACNACSEKRLHHVEIRR